MLTAVGIRTKLLTPEYSTEWPRVRKGLVPFYYQGRGAVIDPSAALEQYFQTGVTPRIGYSDPQLDAILMAERRTFDPAARKHCCFRPSTSSRRMCRHSSCGASTRSMAYRTRSHSSRTRTSACSERTLL